VLQVGGSYITLSLGVRNNILQLFAIKMSAGTVVVPIRPGSDGDATHQPDHSTHTLVDPPTLYLEKIASLWMESRGEALPGKFYHIYIPFFFQCYFRRQTWSNKGTFISWWPTLSLIRTSHNF
jgi:hypothetical protein